MKKMTANRIISIDPGDHIGIVCCTYSIDNPMSVKGTTFEGCDRNMKLWNLLNDFNPDVIIFEQFALRPGMAAKLAGNKFITCEVIGVIKLYVQLNKDVCLIEQLPSTKEYCGFSSNPRDDEYKHIQLINRDEKITEHVRDAYRLYRYWLLFGNKLKTLDIKNKKEL